MTAQQKIKDLWRVRSANPLPTLLLSGSVCLLGFMLFALVAFFIPNTDRSFFPPYLALPESGFELSNYYILYGVICLNALILFGFYLLALRAVGAGNSADSESAGDPAAERREQDNLTDDSVESRRPGIWSDRTNRIIFAFSVIFHLLMFITPFLLSTDVFDYIRHGRIFAFYGENPLVVPATYFPQDPFFSLGGWVGTGSVYGSLHVYITALLARIAGDGVAANLLLFRGFFISLNLVNLILIWKIASRIKPGLERKALVLYGWNPFILTLVVANAHNDILMLALVLAGLLCYLDKRYLIGVFCFTLATLVKFVTLPMLLVYVALVIRKQRSRGKQIAVAASSLTLAIVVTTLSYLPLWVGRDTFLYLFTVGQKTNNTISALVRDTAAGHLQLSVSNIIVQGTLAAILVAYLVWQLIGVKDFNGLVSASAGLALLTPLALFWFQPWYLTLGLGLAALRPWRYMYIAALAFSFSVMFFDSFWWHTPVSMEIQKPLRVLVVFGPPVVLLAILKTREAGPEAWRWLVNWSLAGSAQSLPDGARRPGLNPGHGNLQNRDSGTAASMTDPSPVRLVVEIAVLLVAAAVSMAAVISTSPQLKSLASLIAVKFKLLVNF
ncbi:MAG: glycosyltransferase family 87 protein [Thermoleophilia bacterium]